MRWPPDLSLPSTPIPDFIKQQNPDLELLYLTLRRADQKVFDEFLDAIKQHHAAMKQAENLLPIESLLMLMVLEQNKWLRKELVGLVDEINKLRAEIDAVKS